MYAGLSLPRALLIPLYAQVLTGFFCADRAFLRCSLPPESEYSVANGCRIWAVVLFDVWMSFSSEVQEGDEGIVFSRCSHE